MSLLNIIAGAYNIANQLAADTQGVSGKSNAYRDEIARRAKGIAKREFMYQLKGDNDIIALESLQSLRGEGLKLSASA